MQIGISTSAHGRLAGTAAVRAVATAAEQLGYASIWVGHDGSPASPPDTSDPVPMLAEAAAVTTTVRIGTVVTVGPGPVPAELIRALLGLDEQSAGRLTVGLGLEDGLSAEDATLLESVLDALGPPCC